MASSLRRVIALVKLPGEAQKIDRIIEAFAHHFCSCNPGQGRVRVRVRVRVS